MYTICSVRIYRTRIVIRVRCNPVGMTALKVITTSNHIYAYVYMNRCVNCFGQKKNGRRFNSPSGLARDVGDDSCFYFVVNLYTIGTIFRLKGGVLTMSFLDCNGALIPYAYEAWRDEGRDKQSKYRSLNYTVFNRLRPQRAVLLALYRPNPTRPRLTQPDLCTRVHIVLYRSVLVFFLIIFLRSNITPTHNGDDNNHNNNRVAETPTKNSSGLNRMSPALTGSSESVSSNPGGGGGGGVGGSGVVQLQQQSQVSCDRQFVTIVSEKQVRVVALPSQNCVSKHVIPDADFVVKSEVISMKGNPDPILSACGSVGRFV